MAAVPDLNFTRALPKTELHAHFSGSISPQTLHKIWAQRQSRGELLSLDDPLNAIQAGSQGFVDVKTFFPLFDRYIYALLDRMEWVRFAFQEVLDDFERDGVRYLELRTTPRDVEGKGRAEYVRLLNEMLAERARVGDTDMEAFLILSIDRSMTAEQAMEVVDLAMQYKHDSHHMDDIHRAGDFVVGLDLCGNPGKGDVSIFTPAFRRAREEGLGVTVHFAEVPQSSSDLELETILSWRPERLGHCVHVPEKLKDTIVRECIALELCLSCNVLAGLTSGGFDKHHFREWYERDSNSVILCTDDVGIFGSGLSNEYLIASQSFDLSRQQLLVLARDAVSSVFAGQQAKGTMSYKLDEFAEKNGLS